jgi:crossover junction endodeoxyribonuclease RusA
MTETMEDLTFWVEGTPVPQGSMIGYIVGKKRVNIVHSNAVTLKPWRDRVTGAARAVAAERTFVGAVAVSLNFYVPRGSTVTRLLPFKRPDVDKYIRAILDALTKAGVYEDDGQVVDVHASKRYADDKPGVRIKVSAA